MTVRIAVSLPDDVAERLAREPNVSRFVAEAVRQQIRRERSMDLLAQAGYVFDETDIEAGQQLITEHLGSVSPELAARADERLSRWKRR
ncbi:hypothetical protein [Virgisporangium aliadipatigenens]|nr:hypothetical protein [Virgisporangium aliadipatigenens]